MKKTIKIKFSGFATYHNPKIQPYYRFLADRYDLVESDSPDYIIDGGQDFRHLKYDCVKILFNAENWVPDFNMYDYAVGCHKLTFGDRYVRVPWFAMYDYFSQIANRKTVPDETFLNRKFCSFVVSNSGFCDPLRKEFFERLSKYKKVDSGGGYLNNIGERVRDKVAFCRGYKFNIAFENSVYPGYVTEKIMQAYVAQTVPIYHGDPDVAADFRPESMVLVRGRDDLERAIDEVVRLDQDDELYMAKVLAPCLAEGDPAFYERRLEDFLVSVFDRPLAEARRRCRYGHQAIMGQHLRIVYRADQKLRDLPGYGMAVGIAGKLRNVFGK